MRGTWARRGGELILIRSQLCSYPSKLYSGEFKMYEAEIQFSNVKQGTKDDLPESTREK